MLDHKFTFNQDGDNFGLTLKRDNSWEQSSHRCLIVLESVPSADLKAKELASSPALINCIKYARRLARERDENIPDFSFAVINFNNRRSLHLKGAGATAARQEFRERAYQLIKKLNPTHILMSGNLTALYPLGSMPSRQVDDTMGWQRTIDKRKVVSTLDFGKLMDKDGQYANLLGYFCRHLSYLIQGKHPYAIKEIPLKPYYVDTIEKFERMMKLVAKSTDVGFDTEDRNLSVYHNKLYTAQFCFDAKPDIGFVIPIDHPKTPFDKKSIRYIKNRLRSIFENPDLNLLTFNGKFDLRVARVELGLRIIQCKVWEISAGEHLLDENVSSLPSYGIRGGGLRHVLTSYGQDFYWTAKFSKDERGSIGAHDPRDKAVLAYEAMDAVCLHHIKRMQIRRASELFIGDKPYKSYFINHMLHQMSDTEHQLSHLKQDGSYISRKYLRLLLSAESPLRKELENIKKEFYENPEVQQANQILLGSSGFKAGSLWGSTKERWVFNLNKAEHKKVLFLDVLGLEAVSKTKTGAPAIDKGFITFYKDKHPIVEQYGQYQEAAKLLSTYVKGWYRRLTQDLDGAHDSHLRPDYAYFDVDTGRLCSKNPNLQNIPARGRLAKIIKRMFEAPTGYLLVRFDYSAHEVRGWSIVSGDKELADVFRMGQKLRQEWIQNPCDATRDAIKRDGDVHILNVKRFFNQIVDKSHPLRDAVKAVVFGVIYGKGAKTLGNDTKKAEIDELRKKQKDLYSKLRAGDRKVKKEIEIVEARLIFLLAEDRSAYAQDIIDKLFGEFKRGYAWIKRMGRLAEEAFYTYSPNGRRRNLFAAITQDKTIVAQQVRRGTNAPIQGFASEVAVKAARLIMQSYYKLAPKLLPMMGLPEDYDYTIMANRVVHDALYFAVPYEMVVPFIHVLQYEATYGVSKAYEEEFGIKFTIEPEIEVEVSSRDDHSFKWDWSTSNLQSIVRQALADMHELGRLEQSVDATANVIFGPWRKPKVRNLLQDQFPLLGVHNLDKQIKESFAKAA